MDPRSLLTSGLLCSILGIAPLSAGGETCTPTKPDMLGPFYKAGAPVRSSVGKGYILGGFVRSSADCSPISGAQIEFWLTGPEGNYGDDYRATVPTDEKGAFRFESNRPKPYFGRPSHIHIRVSAPGFGTLVTQHYPESGQSTAVFDLILIPSQ